MPQEAMMASQGVSLTCWVAAQIECRFCTAMLGNAVHGVTHPAVRPSSERIACQTPWCVDSHASCVARSVLLQGFCGLLAHRHPASGYQHRDSWGMREQASEPCKSMVRPTDLLILVDVQICEKSRVTCHRKIKMSKWESTMCGIR